MKRGVLILGFLVVITLIGGILTADVGFAVPLIRQTTDPAASPFMATNDQAWIFIGVVGFILFNVIGAGVTMAIVFWLLNWQVNLAKETPTLEERRQMEEAEALPDTGEKVKALT